MRILCTHPGKFGDILWALPTCHALAETYGTPVDLLIPAQFKALWDLLHRQEYLGNVFISAAWQTQDTAPRTPRVPPAWPGGYDQIFHLGYDGWPQTRLAEQVYNQVAAEVGTCTLKPLDLDRPWITAPAESIATFRDARRHLVIGFTEEWIELKVGVCFALKKALRQAFGDPAVVDILKPPSVSRLDEWAFRDGLYATAQNWVNTAALIASADLFLGCLSSQWVLAHALGIPTVVCEPSSMRWDSPGGWQESIFWRPSPRNTMVLGQDGRPTFDARAVCAAVVDRLRAAGREG